eukprot:GGOE01004070.1.p1 GENE.GGOE01004070.1~~GGOE01004070.1.p1  ORF type:complete len:500 (+),score=137.10 GGOE01004070.1:50-1501(+)
MGPDDDGEGSGHTASSPSHRCSPPSTVQQRLSHWRKSIWGDLPVEEYWRIAFLALIFLLIVGNYWLLRTQKDALFLKICGKLFIPYAKMGTFAVMFPIILLYSKLVDVVSKLTLFYIVCSGYGLLFAAISVALEDPQMGLANSIPSSHRILGWVVYIGIETFASVVVPMFWSFANSTMDTVTAKSGFGLIVWGAQFGSIGGPSLSRYVGSLGIATLVRIGAVGILAILPLMRLFGHCFPEACPGHLTTQRTGAVEGVRLLLKHPYLMGIFGIATFCEIIVTILDYQMKYQLDSAFSNPADISYFMASFGQWTNGVTLAFSFVGTGFFLNRYGLTFCLTAFPVLVAGVVLVTSTVSATSLSVLFYAMVIIKGLSYALNVPCKELLYIPTSPDVKFKTKSWIDMFGARAAKSLASVINAQLRTPQAFALLSAPINLAIACVWLVVAHRTGHANRLLVASNVRVGEPAGPGPEALDRLEISPKGQG